MPHCTPTMRRFVDMHKGYPTMAKAQLNQEFHNLDRLMEMKPHGCHRSGPGTKAGTITARSWHSSWRLLQRPRRSGL